MILISIHLHPFGKFTDKQHLFSNGVHVINGPNEFGKSTISNAIRHALFTTTKMAEKTMQKEIGEWFPHPHGTACAVTLVIEQDGITWTVEKLWSKTPSTVLKSSSGEHHIGLVAEAKIAELVGFNQATWQYVFHTSQAALVQTVEKLAEHSTTLNDLVSSASTSASRDISPERFVDMLNERIEDYYSNWDEQFNRPRDGKGIDNRWKKSVGKILKAYYDWKDIQATQKAVDDYCVRQDILQTRKAGYESDIAQLDQFVKNGQTLRTQLMSRRTFEADIARIEATLADQEQAMQLWPVAQTKVTSSTKELEHLRVREADLQSEVVNAQRHITSESTRKAWRSITEARHGWEAAEHDLSAAAAVGQDTIERIRQHEMEIRDADVRLSAQKLTARITTERDVTVGVASGTSAVHHVPLTAGTEWRDDSISGEVSFTVDGVTLTVASAQENIQDLLRLQQEATSAMRQLLQSSGVETLDELISKQRVYNDKQRARDAAKVAYQQYLDGKSYEEWQQQIANLDAVPSARSLPVINEELQTVTKQILGHEHTITESQRQLDEFAALYTDTRSLLLLVAANASKKTEAESALANLPPLPEGYESAEDFLSDLDERSESLNELREMLAAVTAELRTMPPAPSELSITELQDEVDIKHQAYTRMLAQGQSLQRIRDTVQRVASAQSTSGPMQQLPHNVSKYFEQITNGAYSSIAMVDKVPTKASGSALQDFDVKRLSQGTKTSLALATRLALAEAYLSERPGVIMLDDPCVDMDADRASAAMALLKDVGAQHQVIVFTCHS